MYTIKLLSMRKSYYRFEFEEQIAAIYEFLLNRGGF